MHEGVLASARFRYGNSGAISLRLRTPKPVILDLDRPEGIGSRGGFWATS